MKRVTVCTNAPTSALGATTSGGNPQASALLDDAGTHCRHDRTLPIVAKPREVLGDSCHGARRGKQDHVWQPIAQCRREPLALSAASITSAHRHREKPARYDWAGPACAAAETAVRPAAVAVGSSPPRPAARSHRGSSAPPSASSRVAALAPRRALRPPLPHSQVRSRRWSRNEALAAHHAGTVERGNYSADDANGCRRHTVAWAPTGAWQPPRKVRKNARSVAHAQSSFADA